MLYVFRLNFQARGFTEELQDILMKISNLDNHMITSQPVGGLPETAREQLEKFLVSLLRIICCSVISHWLASAVALWVSLGGQSPSLGIDKYYVSIDVSVETVKEIIIMMKYSTEIP